MLLPGSGLARFHPVLRMLPKHEFSPERPQLLKECNA